MNPLDTELSDDETMLRLSMSQSMGAVAIVCSAAAVGCDADALDGYQPQLGDLVFQSSPRGPLVDAIEGVTRSPFSHVGLLTKRGERWIVIEATGPGVVETPLTDYLRRGRGAGFAVYRLDEKYADRIEPMITAARTFLGKPYDMHYEFDDEKIYCSELLFKAFRTATGEELGIVRKLGDMNWRPYEELIRSIENGGLPLERRMITPKDMAEAKQVRPVMRRGI